MSETSNMDFEGTGLSGEQRMQAMLCAYVLGELGDSERAEVEAALAGSEALRAEKARLEATIGVVSGALQAGAADASRESSTAALAATLQAAAARRARPAWYRSSAFRAAAAVAVVAGGYALYRGAPDAPAPEGGAPLTVATAEATQTKLDATSSDKGAGKKALDDAERLSEVKLAKQGLAESEAAPTPQDQVAQEQGIQAESRFAALPPAGAAVPDPAVVNPQTKGNEITGLDLEQLERKGIWRYPEVGDRQVELDGSEVARLEMLQELGYGGGGNASNPEPKLDSFVGHVAPAEPAAGAEAPAGATTVGIGGGAGGSFGRRLASRAGGAASPPSPTSSGPGGAVPSRDGDLRARAGGLYDAPAAAEPALKDAELAEESLELADDRNRFDEKRKAAAVDSDEYHLGEGLTPLERNRRYHEHRLHELELACRYRPDERPRDMFFRFWGDNPFEIAAIDKLSTFSADVDTASYALARKYLVQGHLPTKEQIRTEEFVNYFKGDVPPPSEGAFRVALEMAPSLFGETSDLWMLRVAVRGREVARQERMPLALTFVVDVSGSMREGARLELVKHALRMLTAQLDVRDTISVVTFSDNASLVLPPTSARHKDLIESAIHPLQPQSSTNTEAGLRMGYAQAAAALTKGANNRVVLLTDGVANVGITDPNALVQMVDDQRKLGILLNTVGVGMDNHNDHLLEQLADKGDGLCNYVDDEQEVRRALVDNFTGAFEPIARDVKLQVEFDPAQVSRYRLLGYENRAVADADFRNDKVDAGEIGAGHQVVALYEIARTLPADPAGPLATVRLRYKEPYRQGVADRNEETPVHEIEQSIGAKEAAGAFAATSAGYRRAVLVAQLAEFLRRSVHARTDSLDRLLLESKSLAAELKTTEFDEFVGMVETSRALVAAELARRDRFDDCGDLIRRNCYLRQQIEHLRRELGEASRLEELEQRTRELERRLQDLRGCFDGAEFKVAPAFVTELERENAELERQLHELLRRLRLK